MSAVLRKLIFLTWGSVVMAQDVPSQSFVPPSNLLDVKSANRRLTQLKAIELERRHLVGFDLRKNVLFFFASHEDSCLLLTIFSYETELPGMYTAEAVLILPGVKGQVSRRLALCPIPTSVVDPLLERSRALLCKTGYPRDGLVESSLNGDEFELSAGTLHGAIRGPIARSEPGKLIRACFFVVEAVLKPFGKVQDEAFGKIPDQLKKGLSNNDRAHERPKETAKATEVEAGIKLMEYFEQWRQNGLLGE